MALLEEVKRLGLSDWSGVSQHLLSRGVERNRNQCRQRIHQIWNKFQKTEGDLSSWGQVIQYHDGPSLSERRLDGLHRSLRGHYDQWMEKEGASNTAAMTPGNRIELIEGVVFSPKGLRLFTRHLQQSLPSKEEKIKRTLPKKRERSDYVERSESEEDVDDPKGGEEEEEEEEV